MKSNRLAQRLMAGVMAVGILAGTAVAFAQSTPPQGPQGPGQHQGMLTPEDRQAMAQIFWNRMKEQLGLNDDQVTALRTTMQQQRDKMRPNVQALRDARKQLWTAMQNPNASEGDIRTAAAEVNKAQTQLFNDRIDGRIAMWKVLTPDQRSKWIELRKNMRPRWGGARRGMGGPGGPGMGFGPGM